MGEGFEPDGGQTAEDGDYGFEIQRAAGDAQLMAVEPAPQDKPEDDAAENVDDLVGDFVHDGFLVENGSRLD